MASKLQKIVHIANQTLIKCSPRERQKNLLALTDHINRLCCDDIEFDRQILRDDTKFDSKFHRAPVTYVHLLENDAFSMGVFIVKNGARLPLHDHPNMSGILKIIHGSVSIQCFTEVPGAVIPKYVMKFANPPWQTEEEVRRVVAQPQQIMNNESEACHLTPTDSNFHEIYSVGGVAAFFDILFPPYDQIVGSRICKYYRPIWPPTAEERNNQLSEQYLLETGQPNDFWCNSLLYTGPDLQNLDTKT